MGKRGKGQDELFVTYKQMRSEGHPFYQALEKVLRDNKFDRYVESLCVQFYAPKMGRPGLPPGVYFRCLLVGYFEGLDSERAIAWRVADSLSLRTFLGLPLKKDPPDHSTVSRTRRLIDLETHQAVFTWALGVLDAAGLVPHEPDAEITKMKDGRTHLAHKQEHGVDMDTGAVVAVTLHGGATGDTTTIEGTLEAAKHNLEQARQEAGEESKSEEPEEAVADKGYHSRRVMLDLQEAGCRTYISEPRRGPQHWEGQLAERNAVYANRRRKNGPRGQRLQRRRGELIERGFAHTLETGGMRRTHLRGHENIAKRMLVHVAGFNLGLLMRRRYKVGKPRCLQGRAAAALWAALVAILDALLTLMRLPTIAADESPPHWSSLPHVANEGAAA